MRKHNLAGDAAEDADGSDSRRIDVVDIVKDYHTEVGLHRVLKGISFSVGPGERLAVLGRNGAGKSTLIQILAGYQRPTSGYVRRGLSLSWPLALSGGFQGELTGYDNLRFIARVYDVPLQETYEFVEDFSELGKQLHVPVRFYSDGMRMRLAFALSLAIDFDCFLVDEALLVGDQRFREKCQAALFGDRADRAMILAIHETEVVRQRCTSALVLRRGHGKLFDNVDFACTLYETMS